jgi:hypothetical protein
MDLCAARGGDPNPRPVVPGLRVDVERDRSRRGLGEGSIADPVVVVAGRAGGRIENQVEGDRRVDRKEAEKIRQTGRKSRISGCRTVTVRAREAEPVAFETLSLTV